MSSLDVSEYRPKNATAELCFPPISCPIMLPDTNRYLTFLSLGPELSRLWWLILPTETPGGDSGGDPTNSARAITTLRIPGGSTRGYKRQGSSLTSFAGTNGTPLFFRVYRRKGKRKWH